MTSTRRDFLKQTGAGLAALGLGAGSLSKVAAAQRDFKISLAAYSLHRTIAPGKTPTLDLPQLAKDEFGIDAIELVNWMLASDDPAYLKQFSAVAESKGVKVLLIMVDRAGSVGARNERARASAVEKHNHWIDIAADMGCHSIRMNWAGAPKNIMADPPLLQQFIETSVGPLRQICDHGDQKDINVIIENHGGPSSFPDTLVKLVKAVDHERFGTLPDFGNFPPKVGAYGGPRDVDVYDGVDKMMPFAKAVSAKCYDFDDVSGEETKLDYARLLDIVVDKHGYNGYIGIEYEGNRLSEFDGIKGCKKLLEKLRG